jgi:type I restriction enzyme S subunit
VSTGKTDKSIAFPANWDVRPLGKVVQPTRPRIKPSEKPNLPFIGMENIKAHTMKLLGTVPAGTMKSSAVHFQPDDVLYGRLRPYLNKVYRPDFEGLCSTEFIVFPKTESISSRYLQYFLNSSSFASYASHLNAGDRPRVDFEQLSPYPFPVAPFEQQKLIVAEIEKQFSRLDEAVANLKRVKANLKRYRASVLKAAVEGKLTEDWRKQHPNVEPASELLKRILAERRTKWNGRGKYREPAKPGTSEPLFLPEKWTWTTIDQLTAMVTSGSRGWGEYYSDTGPLFIRAQDIKTDSLNFQTIARVGIPENVEGTRTAVTKGDILITITGANVTKSALVKQLQEQAFVSQHVALLKPSLASVSTYLFTWVVSPAHGRKMLERWAYGAGKPGLSLDQVRSLTVALPPLAEQHQIAAEVERRLSIIEELETAVEANLTRADRLRQSILSQAFSGRLLRQDTKHIPNISPTFSIAAESQASYGRTTLPGGEPR